MSATQTQVTPGLESLARILEPHVPEEFLNSSWGIGFLHVRGRAGRFAHMMPWERLSEILGRHRLDRPRLRLVRDGKPVPAAAYLRHTTNARQGTTVPRLKAAGLAQQLREGATLVLDAVDELSEPVEELAKGLELFFHERVQVNLYAGWQTSRGFDLHWDDHDVFVLQVAGRKRWSVYGQTRPYPLVNDIEKAQKPEHAPLWEGTLEDGDLLYIPRGWWHVAMPLAEPTLHLTVGVHNRTGLDFLRWFSEGIRASELFRRDLPRFASPAERAAYNARLRQELLNAWDDSAIERYYEDLDARAEPRARVGLPWVAMPGAAPPEGSTVVRLLAPRSYRLEAAGGVVEFDAIGQHWRFAEEALPVLRALDERRVCTVAELCEAARGRVAAETVRALLSELAHRGFVAFDVEGQEGA